MKPLTLNRKETLKTKCHMACRSIFFFMKNIFYRNNLIYLYLWLILRQQKVLCLFNVICRSTTKNNINYFKKDVVFPSTVISCIILLIKYYENNLFIYKYMSFLIKKNIF